MRGRGSDAVKLTELVWQLHTSLPWGGGHVHQFRLWGGVGWGVDFERSDFEWKITEQLINRLKTNIKLGEH